MWTLAMGLVLQSTSTGGSLVAVGPIAATACVVIALVGLVWPPPVRPDAGFVGATAIGVVGIVVLAGSLGSAILGSDDVLRGVRPSPAALYPWAVALLATASFSGLGIADRLLARSLPRRGRTAIGLAGGFAATLAMVGAVVATTGATTMAAPDDAAACHAPLDVPSADALRGTVAADIDLRPAETVRVHDPATGPGFVRTALAPTLTSLAQDLGTATIGGAAVRHCRIHTTGAVIGAAIPETAPMIGDGDISRWRGELDYWIGTGGIVVLVDGSIGGEAFALGERGLIGDLAFRLELAGGDG
jgi:hypothetical protein